MHCSPCGQEGRKGVTVTVPAPLPAIRPEVATGTPADLDIITRRKSGPERWWCGSCRGSAPTPAPGEPCYGWLSVYADGQLLARACCAECLALLLPSVNDALDGKPWQRPEPAARGSVVSLMREAPRRRG